MFHQHGWRLLSCLVSLSACADDPVVPPMGDAIGRWRHLPHDPTRTPVEQREVVELRADGTFEIRDRRGTQTGTYRIDGHDLTIEPSSGGFITTGFAATADRLIVDALFPDAVEDDGLVGRWIGVQSSQTASTLVELELRRDGSAHIEQTGALADAVDVTWTADLPYLVVTFTEPTRMKSLPALPHVAVGEWLYERLE